MSVDLEAQIDQWRGFVARRPAMTTDDIVEMEDHLRNQIADLAAGGLEEDEAFLVAVKRMGNLDDVSREFAREHSERLWRQLVLIPEPGAGVVGSRWRDLGLVIGVALLAGVVLKILIESLDEFALIRNVAFVLVPAVAGWLAYKRRVPWRVAAVLTAVAAGLLLVVNLYPFEMIPWAGGGGEDPGMTAVLVVIHTPVVLWLLTAVAYAGGDWRSHGRRMDFVRFTGELAMYLALITAGAGVLIGLSVGVWNLAGFDLEPYLENWILPFGIPGAIMVAAWLVEVKMNVVENIAPVLTKVFTPLALVMLVAMFAVMVLGDSFDAVDRNLLILMDAVLILVVALLLYSISAHNPMEPAGVFDWLQLGLVVAALAVDAIALSAMLTRIAEFGWTANKTAALGLNLILLAHLAWTGWLTLGFVRRTGTFHDVERWQTRYLPVYGLWAAVVVVAFPLIFSFA
ncbi:permease prefix domain 1-containing protein [Nocardioides sp. NPDC057577]|uniref:permease prefix domain 1-containing protein n=1 Tax=Nocardioides sp. NPDC057577 TaxID=3346171 RepID=UPI0036727B6E